MADHPMETPASEMEMEVDGEDICTRVKKRYISQCGVDAMMIDGTVSPGNATTFSEAEVFPPMEAGSPPMQSTPKANGSKPKPKTKPKPEPKQLTPKRPFEQEASSDLDNSDLALAPRKGAEMVSILQDNERSPNRKISEESFSSGTSPMDSCKRKSWTSSTSSLSSIKAGKGPVTLKEEQFITEFIILGISQFTEAEAVSRALNIIKKMLSKDVWGTTANIIKDISKAGRSVNEDALLLCLAKCYLDDEIGKLSVYNAILDICRIPTQLFKFLRMLQIEDDNDDANPPNYYEVLLKGLGSNAQQSNKNTGNKKRKKKKLHPIAESEKDDQTERSNPNPSSNQSEAMDDGAVPMETVSANDGSEETNQSKQDKGFNRNRFIGRHKKLINMWYTDRGKSAEDLLLLLTKYQGRYGWDHKTLFRLTHPKIAADDEEKTEKDIVIQYHLNGIKKVRPQLEKFLSNPDKVPLRQISNIIFGFIDILEEVKGKGDAKEVAEMVKNSVRHAKQGYIPYTSKPVPATPSTEVHEPLRFPEKYIPGAGEKGKRVSRLHLTTELLPTKMYNEKVVWQELIKDIPMSAMLGHITHMSKLKLFDDEENINYIRDALTNPDRLYPFVHPFKILKAIMAYHVGSSRHKQNGKSWEINPKISDILYDAFYISLLRKQDLSFNNCVICIDMSIPMTTKGFLGFDMFSPSMVAVAIATAIEKKGKNNSIYTCGENEKKLLELHYKNSDGDIVQKPLRQIIKETEQHQGEKTSLSLPIEHCCAMKQEVDAFIIFTKAIKNDFCGKSPCVMFNQYNKEMLKNSRLVVCSMEANYRFLGDKDSEVVTICGGDADILPKIVRAIKYGIPRNSSFSSSFDTSGDTSSNSTMM